MPAFILFLMFVEDFSFIVECFCRTDSFNYDYECKGVTERSVSSLQKDKELSDKGFLLNHARVQIGSGQDTYEKGKNALQNWRYVSFCYS